ncbi:MAG: lipoyl(octanoyl) transferase LipB, partial [Candidatus Kapaibacterium sp.]
PNNRGGDVTIHNPGQLIGYPLFHLSDFREDLHWFLRELEESVIDTLRAFDISSHRIDGLTGVWVGNERKICAIGVHCSQWVMSHGFALNVANDTTEFDHIIPCGIHDKSVTSMSKELGYPVDIETVADVCEEVIMKRFSEVKKNL